MSARVLSTSSEIALPLLGTSVMSDDVESGPVDGPSWATQFRAMLVKNLKTKRRNYKTTFYELLMPVYFVLILVYAVAGPLKTPIDSPAICGGGLGEAACSSTLPRGAALCPESYGTPALLWAPNDTVTAALWDDAALVLETSATVCASRGFASAADLRAWVEDPASPAGGVAAGVIFAGDGAYEVLLPRSSPIDLRRLDEYDEDYADRGDGDGARSPWSIALSVQWACDAALAIAGTTDAAVKARLRAGKVPILAKLPVAALKMPYAPSSKKQLSYMVPLYLIWGPTATLGYLCNLVVLERPALEALKQMGLKVSASILAWWATFAGLHTVSAGVVTLGVAASDLLPGANIVLLFVTLELFVAALIASGFLVCAATADAKTAQGLASLLYVFGMGLYCVDLALGRPRWFEWLLCSIDCFAAAPTGILNFVEAALRDEPFGWGDIFSGQTPLVAVWGCLVLNFGLYVALAAYAERVARGGRRRCFRLETEAAILEADGGDDAVGSPLRASAELPRRSSSAAKAASFKNVSVIYPPSTRGANPVVALRGLDLDLEVGQVTALLGQNGAGKTSAINALTGVAPIAGGSARVFGRDVAFSLDAVRGSLGVCPQADRIFDALTVHEHALTAGGVKGLTGATAAREADRWIAAVGLTPKSRCRAKALSGGQKRKLAVALAMIGDPALIILDEPTAGVDPESRRALWDLILEARRARSFLLTTHFMDEADALADRIAILAATEKGGGALKCVDSALGLKQAWGSGYRLRFSTTDAVDANGLLALARTYVPDAAEVERQRGEYAILIGSDRGRFEGLLAACENTETLKALGADAYGIALPSLQDAFLAAVGDARAEAVVPPNGGLTGVDRAPKPPASPRRQLSIQCRLGAAQLVANPPRVVVAMIVVLAALAFVIPAVSDLASEADADARFATRRIRPFGGAGAYLAYTPPAPGAAAQTTLVADAEAYGYRPDAVAAVAGGAVDAAVAAIQRTVPPHSFAALVLQNATDLLATVGTALLYNSSFPNAPPAFLALLDRAALGAAVPGFSAAPSVGFLPAPGRSDHTPAFHVLDVILPPLLMELPLMLAAMLPVYAIVADRVHRTKHQSLLMGLDVRIYWAAALAVAGALAFASIVPVALASAYWSGGLSGAALPALALVLVTAIPAILAFGFVLSFLFKTLESVGLFVMVYLLISVGPNLVIQLVKANGLKAALTYATLLIPVNQFISGISCCLWIQAVATLEEGTPTVGDFLVFAFRAPGAAAPLPGPLTCVAYSLASILFYGLVVYVVDVRVLLYPGERRGDEAPARGGAADADEDEDVAEERRRIAAGAADALVVDTLAKAWPKTLAVDGLSFGVPAGSCFALLGPNGAGKTSAIGCCTGGVFPSGGDVLVGGESVRTDLVAIYRRTGFCPQSGGLWEFLTVRQHLAYYLSLKDEADVAAAAAAVEAGYGLSEHAFKRVKELSGGTKRKLSAAIALACGSPAVVFLDEPTTGVDASTRRFIWDRIRDATPRSAVLLTTHYMDEADFLADRIGIMARGRLRILGSAQHLKSRHGGGSRVETRGGGESAAVDALFAGARKIEAHAGARAYELGPGHSIAAAFRVLEKAADDKIIDNYAISQTTLEQVFLNVAAASGGADPDGGADAPRGR